MDLVRRYFRVELANLDASCLRLGMSVVSFPEKMRISYGTDCGGKPCINASVPRIVNCSETVWEDRVSNLMFFKWVERVTKAKATLISAQQTAVDAILAASEQGKKAASYGHTLLNKKARVLTGIRKQYQKDASRLGFTVAQIETQWNDVKDMAKLEAAAE